MGATPYSYYVKYQPNLQAALRDLRDREFKAGRYSPEPDPAAPHASIADALLAAEADGTASILDLDTVADRPGFGVAHRLGEAQLQQLFGTTRPTHQMIENSDDLFDQIDRGQGVCIVVYKDDQPDEIFFAGYSFD